MAIRLKIARTDGQELETLVHVGQVIAVQKDGSGFMWDHGEMKKHFVALSHNLKPFALSPAIDTVKLLDARIP